MKTIIAVLIICLACTKKSSPEEQVIPEAVYDETGCLYKSYNNLLWLVTRDGLQPRAMNHKEVGTITRINPAADLRLVALVLIFGLI